LSPVSHRLATLADFEAVYAIYMADEVIPYLGFDPMSRASFLGVMQGLVASRAFYVVEREGRVRGFYRASRGEGRARHVARLGTLAVAPEEQGSGLARSMIEAAIATLYADGVTRIELTVEAGNPRAQRFYGKLGFELEGTMRHAYRRSDDSGYVDQLLMARLLSAASPG
jgi:RimJ/RimL family protein N-acetyltransferase